MLEGRRTPGLPEDVRGEDENTPGPREGRIRKKGSLLTRNV